MNVVRLSREHQASYEVVGTGDPLLMYPGGPGFPAVIVREDAELFADRFEVYLIDPPGNGDSSSPQKRDDYCHLGPLRQCLCGFGGAERPRFVDSSSTVCGQDGRNRKRQPRNMGVMASPTVKQQS